MREKGKATTIVQPAIQKAAQKTFPFFLLFPKNRTLHSDSEEYFCAEVTLVPCNVILKVENVTFLITERLQPSQLCVSIESRIHWVFRDKYRTLILEDFQGIQTEIKGNLNHVKNEATLVFLHLLSHQSKNLLIFHRIINWILLLML